jgi:hypothetical protein
MEKFSNAKLLDKLTIDRIKFSFRGKWVYYPSKQTQHLLQQINIK